MTLRFSVLVVLLACAGGCARIVGLQDFSKHVGKYPCRHGWLEAPVLQAELKALLGKDFEDYREHITFSGCGAIERRGPYLLMDVSQLHVGGYTSIILIRESDRSLVLMWLKTRVYERDLQIYSRGPIDESALQVLRRAMNVAWGHVACFVPEGRSLRIDLARRANQDTGECEVKPPAQREVIPTF